MLKLFFVNKKIRENYITIDIVQQIIRKNINNQITSNIIDPKDLKEMQNKFQSICIKVGQKVVYLILQKLFYYSKIIKPKKYKKPIMQIFIEVKYFYKYFQIAIILDQNF